MKTRLLFTILTIVAGSTVSAQTVTIPDYFLANWFQNNYPACITGDQLNTNCPDLQNASVVNLGGLNIQNLSGIEHLTSLDTLISEGGYINNVPALPASLKLLNLVNNQIASLPALPPGLQQLLINNNWLTQLPTLPNTLVVLDCFGNNLTSLPALPQSIKVIHAEANEITSLPALPDSLIQLGISQNPIAALPALPSTLGGLYASSTLISQLPALPLNNDYFLLDAANNPNLTSLPPMPPVISYLYLGNNPQLSCLPPIEYIGSFVDISNTGISCLPNIIQHPGSWPHIDTLPLCGIFSSGCQVGWNVTGQAYNDANNNCMNEAGEGKLQHAKAMLYHNGTLVEQAFTNANGTYSFDTDLSGGYTVQFDANNMPMTVTCPANNSYDVDVTVADSLDDGADFGLVCGAGYDVGVSGIVNNSGMFFPGDTAGMKVFAGDFANFFGTTCNTAGMSGQVQVNFTGPAMYVGSTGTLAPSSVTGNNLVWDVADFSSVDFSESFAFALSTNTTATIGEQVCVSVTVNASTPNADNNLSNNALTHCFLVVNSYDPNMKAASPAHTATPGGWITYTVHFQNMGTAPAHNIAVLDTLDANIDVQSFQLTGTSHQATTQISGNVAKFTFMNIMLADSASNEPESHGWLQYRVKAKDNLALNTTIENSASIYFDYNAPVVTNTTQNTYEVTSVNDALLRSIHLEIFPNPGSQFVSFRYGAVSGNARIVVSDMSGRKVAEHAASPVGYETFALETLADGVYRVQLVNGNQTLASQKLVVIR